MKTTRQFRPQLEVLEDRMLLSTSVGLAPPAGGSTAQASQPHSQPIQISNPLSIALKGQVSGVWAIQSTLPNTSATQTLNGSGTVTPLGAVSVQGTLHTPGSAVKGRTTATLTFSTAQGSITVQLTSQTLQPASSSPATYSYTITGGTGAYAGASGHGQATLQEKPAAGPVSSPGTVMPDYMLAPQFTLTF